MLSTVNHKNLGLAYFAGGVAMGMSGWMASVLMRIELSRSGALMLAHESPEIYNVLITLHGVTMIFFLVMPTIWGGVANVIQPCTVGSCEVAYPAINNGALLVLLASFAVALLAISGEFLGGLGWVLYAPLSTSTMSASDLSVLGLTGALLVNGTSSTGSSTNFTAIVSNCKVAVRATIYPVAIVVVSVLLLASLPSLTGGLIMITADVTSNTTFFATEFGGDVLFWQHLFWIFGHPEVYVLIIPAFGLNSLLVTEGTGSDVAGAAGMIGGTVCIAVLGFVVWAHHMYTTGMEADARAYFSAATYGIAVPTGLKITHWVASMSITFL